MDFFADDFFCGSGEVFDEGAVEGLEFGPEDGIDEGFWGFDHDGGCSLSGVAVGFEVVAVAEGDEELSGPGIVEGDAYFDGFFVFIDGI